MKNTWIIKTAIQHIVSLLPKNYWWNSLIQKHISKGYYPRDNVFKGKLNCCRAHFNNYHTFSPMPESEIKVIELGTGPWPIIPIGLSLCGSFEIWTYDLAPLIQRDNLRQIFELFIKFDQQGQLKQLLGNIQQERIDQLKNLLGIIDEEEPIRLLETLNIHVCIGDAREIRLPSKSIDFIFSTVVLEHIPKKILIGLFQRFRQLSSPNAIMSHYVGLADQYASFDNSITPYNFLKYSDRQWRILNNPIIPLTRLRIADYREILAQTNWNIVDENNSYGSIEEFSKIRLAPKFRKFTTEDLLVLYSWLVAKPI